MRATAFNDARSQRTRGQVLALASLSFLTGIMLHATLLAPRPHPTDARSDRPGVKSDDGVAASSEGSITRAPHVEHGVPSGFDRTTDGAVAAAASYVCTGQSILDMDPLSAEEAIRQMAAAGTADQQVDDMLTKLRAARDALAAGKGDTVFRQAAIAWRVESSTPDRASVAIWSVGVLARDGVAPPQAGWATSTFELVWERDDWKIESEVIVPGPAPTLDNSTAPATASQFVTSLQGFSDFGNAR